MTIDLIPTPVPVTAHHIACGRRFRCYSCPMALAVDELLIDGYSAHVSPSELAITTHLIPRMEPGEVVIPLPAAAIRFVEDFDDERPVSPRDYLIPLPRHLLRDPPPLPPAGDSNPSQQTRDIPRP